MILKNKKLYKVALLFFLIINGGPLVINATNLDDEGLFHRNYIYNRDTESLNFFILNGFDFKTTHVLFDKDINLKMYSTYGILVNLTTNEVIFERQADKRAYPASLTKMMTVLVGLENIKEDTMRIDVDFNELAAEGAAIAGFRNGEIVSAKDILMAVMLPSGADAAITLAKEVVGSEAEFVNLMNQKAEALGMKDTHFENVTGLHHDNHYTTARDMAILVKVALNNPEFREIFMAKSYITETVDDLIFTSRMFDRMSSPVILGGEVLGGKTGYTWEALLCLASFATDGENEYALITMHANGGPNTAQYHVIDALETYEYFFNR